MDQYKVLFDSNIFMLVDLVNAAMREGWRPCGGIAPDVASFYQAMVLLPSEPTPPTKE